MREAAEKAAVKAMKVSGEIMKDYEEKVKD